MAAVCFEELISDAIWAAAPQLLLQVSTSFEDEEEGKVPREGRKGGRIELLSFLIHPYSTSI